MRGMKAAATAAAFTALAAAVGGTAFLLARDDNSPAPVAATTSTQGPPTEAELGAAIAAELAQGLEVPLTTAQADCVAGAFLAVVGPEGATELVGEPRPLGAVTIAQRAEIIRGIVECVPPEVASALLGTPTTSTAVAPQLPDEGA